MEEALSNAWKAPGGLIRGDAKVVDGLLVDVRLTGDFFIFPSEAIDELERALEGSPVDRDVLEVVVASVLDRGDVEAVGFGPEDVVNALLGPLGPQGL